MHERTDVHLDGHPAGDDDRRVPAITNEDAQAIASGVDPRVPYAKFGPALELAHSVFPDEVSMRVHWTPTNEDELAVEVWRHWEDTPGGHLTAKVIPVSVFDQVPA